jgi:hypothetical protein
MTHQKQPDEEFVHISRIDECLTTDEMMACMYVYTRSDMFQNLADSVLNTIRHLCKAGYEFQGLGDDGIPTKRVKNQNRQVIQEFQKSRDHVRLWNYLSTGRKIIKEHCPKLLGEEDEEWSFQVSRMQPN